MIFTPNANEPSSGRGGHGELRLSDEHDNKILIYGGGLIGGTAAKVLSDTGSAVTVVTKAPSLQNSDNIDWRFGDLSSERPDETVAGSQAVIYAAGSLSPASLAPSISQLLTSQVTPVIELAEQAARLKIPNFVFISSGGTVYGQTEVIPTHEDVRTAPINAYGMIKVQTEQALLEVARQSGMRVIILRVSNPYGPGQQGTRRLGFIAAAAKAASLAEPLTIWGDGLSSRDFIYLSDVANAIRLAAFYRGDSEIFNIGSGTETSLRQICDLVSRIGGSPVDVRYEQSRSVDVRRNVLDIKKAAQLLNWHPEISLETGIAKTIRH